MLKPEEPVSNNTWIKFGETCVKTIYQDSCLKKHVKITLIEKGGILIKQEVYINGHLKNTSP